MLLQNDLHVGDIYKHDTGKPYAKLLRVIGDSESGGAVTIEMAGEIITMGLALFMRKFNTVNVQELGDHAYEDQG